MNFYIDFDHTLYNTNALITDMLNAIAQYLYDNGDFGSFPERFQQMYPKKQILSIKKDFGSITKALKDNFERPEKTALGIDYNISALIAVFSQLFNCNTAEIDSQINCILDNGKDYLYDDSISFLKYLKNNRHNVYILSHDRYSIEFQNQKIRGSGIVHPDLLDATIVTKASKANLDSNSLKDPTITSVTLAIPTIFTPDCIDYKHSIFIDDRPKDLEALFKSVYQNEFPPFNIRIYRMARLNGTYSNIQFSSPTYRFGIKKVIDFTQLKHILSTWYSQSNER